MRSVMTHPGSARRASPRDTRPPGIVGTQAEDAGPGSRRMFVRGAAGFLAVLLLFYGVLYVASEWLVLETGQRNRFHRIATLVPGRVDVVIVGASHALPLDFEDMNRRLEERSGRRVVNLAVEGGGIVVSRLLHAYFAARHEAKHLVLFLDSFAFYTTKWNEERLDDVKLFRRAPLDIDLVQVLWQVPAARPIALNFVSGFLKINNADRFRPDVSEAEVVRFGRTYRSVAQIDRQRIAYLYPARVDPAVFARYLGELDGLLGEARRRGTLVTAVKPPTPLRYRSKLPDEAAFDAAIREVLARHGARFEDMSGLLPEDRNYYDTDHLNRTGTAAFIDGPFGALLGALP